ncbi:ADP-ribose pyrophosphatase [Leptospira perolatii]|uniref:GDP-mannose pyrophosphatase n=1 Tax=Leptospira perolatii TaxID=2023191 RepID=A0A2M9ZKG9_9LEPT|nr:NUDIX hydrolase [Leptospira perolatii]PJZ69264.1 ADP-ribose pyrophosphatase [Leptospira perolatii]PJZ72433.1 ADP-ribose pyrophosphatase [Leptospira perolatii]
METFDPEKYRPEQGLWKQSNPRILNETPIFKLVANHTESPDGAVSKDFFHLQSKDWVNVIALTPENEIILIDQYRHGLHRYSLEIPGGIADKSGILESAQAELKEETGFVSDDWEFLGKVSGNPAVFNNWCHTFIAKNVRSTGIRELDDSEQIRVFTYPLEKVPSLIEKQLLHHGMMVAALGMYFLKYPLTKTKIN